MDIILSLLFTIGIGLFAFATFIMAEHKDDWNDTLDRIGSDENDN